ncbi:MAG TPA: hypothetical protein VEI07_07055 [Planctomycetaceae bacterium]|nr:hypothetical protein [Planctomycetaceae bacterium]
MVVHLFSFVFCATLGGSVARADKPTLTIALDDGPRSRMLKSELTRDWTQPNPAIARRLTRSQKQDVATRGTQLNALAAKIDGYFRIVYATAEDVPLPVKFHLPAVRINRGTWETLDRRAFAFEGRPLATLDWYRARHASISRDTPRAPGSDYWSYCTEEGWSGAETVETPAPWERSNPFLFDE